jgi:hypothetical protein
VTGGPVASPHAEDLSVTVGCFRSVNKCPLMRRPSVEWRCNARHPWAMEQLLSRTVMPEKSFAENAVQSSSARGSGRVRGPQRGTGGNSGLLADFVR